MSTPTPYVQGIKDAISYVAGSTFAVSDALVVDAVLALLRSFEEQGGYSKWHRSETRAIAADVACDRAYINGAYFGWKAALHGDREKFEQALAGRNAEIASALKNAAPQGQGRDASALPGRPVAQDAHAPAEAALSERGLSTFAADLIASQQEPTEDMRRAAATVSAGTTDGRVLPDCMLPDGAFPCTAYQQLKRELAAERDLRVNAELDRDAHKAALSSASATQAITVCETLLREEPPLTSGMKLGVEKCIAALRALEA